MAVQLDVALIDQHSLFNIHGQVNTFIISYHLELTKCLCAKTNLKLNSAICYKVMILNMAIYYKVLTCV
jgi:hypothetical protein